MAKKAIKKVGNAAKTVAKKAGKVAGNVVKAVGKFHPLALLIKKLKPLVGKFLKWMLKRFIPLLPKKVQGIADMLGKKMGILKEYEEYESFDLYQQELDLAIVNLIAEPELVEQEIQAFSFESSEDISGEAQWDELALARENFIKDLSELEENEDPKPAIENFLTAILTAAKLGIKIIGRDKVIKKLAELLSNLVSKYIGKANAQALATEVVKAGFNFLQLETPQSTIEEGSSIIASTVEDTVKQVLQLPESVLDNEVLLDNYLVEAFEKSAAVNMPDVLPEDFYKQRPDLRETLRKNMLWKIKRNGRKWKNSRYKKALTWETELTPYLADELKTFEGVSISQFVNDAYGKQVHENMPVKLHLFETLPGGTVYDIAENENFIPSSLNNNRLSPWQILHPFTSRTAGLLLKEPKLGCKCISSNCLNKNHHYAKVHRYYFLEIPGARLRSFSDARGDTHIRRSSRLLLKLNFFADSGEIKINYYLSEADAQEVISLLRKNSSRSAGLAHQILAKGIHRDLLYAFDPYYYGNLRIEHPALVPGKLSEAAIKSVPPLIQRALKEYLAAIISVNLKNFTEGEKFREFIKAAEHPEDGLTIQFILKPSFRDMDVVKQFISGGTVDVPSGIFSERDTDVQMKISPGLNG